MAVMMVDVPKPSWNEVVIQCVLFGLDYCPDIHRQEGNTLVEITGTREKLHQVLTRVQKKVSVENLGVVESKLIDVCR
jgi:hypothetical protein